MNRVIARAKITLVLILAFAAGTAFFVYEYFVNCGDWVLFPGSPHVYNAANIGCGLITDREGILLLDMTGERTYASNTSLRKGTVHWLGDRKGNVSAPALSHYAQQIAGFDPIGGVYDYGGTGAQVKLTLSGIVQAAAVDAMGAYKGTIAVYNYKTGEILCAVSTPNFDPDDALNLDLESDAFEGVFVNRFVRSAYTPGSIFKIVTAAAALESIPDIEQQVFSCNGVMHYGIDQVTCMERHGLLSFRQAFAVSCNCAFAQIAGQLGGETLQHYAQAFGINGSISFDGITTTPGNVEAQGAADVLVAWSAIGQHKDLINPCSFMTFLGAIASGGSGVEPYVVSEIIGGGKTVYDAQSVSTGRMLSSQTAQTLQQMMRSNVVDKYGAQNFPGLTVCAKSGTAEVGPDKKPNAMFAGFVADEQYPLAFIVAVEDGGYGRQICVPILSKVLAACKEVMDAK